MRSSLSIALLVMVMANVSMCVGGDEFEHHVSHIRVQMLEILFTGALDRELEITAPQHEKLAAVRVERKESLRDKVVTLQQAQTNGRAGRRTIPEINSEVDMEASEKVARILLPFQERRWKQIAMQMLFIGDKSVAFITPSVSADLELTDAQKKEMNRLFSEGEAERRQADKEIRRKREQLMQDVLTPDQRGKLGKLFGPPFIFGKEQ